jgi:hypothetical protein
LKAIIDLLKSAKKLTNESEKKPEIDHKKLIKFPKALWESLEAKAQEENQDNMTEFIRYICREYLKTDGFKNKISIDEELIELEKRQEQFRNEEIQFFSNLNSLLKSAKNEEKPLDYEEKILQVLTSIEKQKLDFEGIYQATKIPKDQLVVLLGNLVESEEILYDNRWRYYKA